MTIVYTLNSGSIPAYAELEAQLGASFTMTPVSKVESLAKVPDEPGVVLLGGEPLKLATQVSLARTIAPRLGCVAVVERGHLRQLDPAIAQQADILVSPFDPLEVTARINAALQVSELRHLIEASAQLDEITELYNHQFFIKRLGEEMSLAKRHLSPLTCVVIGVSYYDVYMDSYGYDFVAAVLRQIATIAQEQVRTEDIVARLGDSEIAFLLPRSTERGALSLARRVIDNVEEHPFYLGDQIEHLFLKAGIAGYPVPEDDDVDADTLVRYARHALHHARCSEDQKLQLFSELKPFVG